MHVFEKIFKRCIKGRPQLVLLYRRPCGKVYFFFFLIFSFWAAGQAFSSSLNQGPQAQSSKYLVSKIKSILNVNANTQDARGKNNLV